MRLVSVFDCEELPRDLLWVVCIGQGNGTFHKVHFDDGKWNEKTGEPLDGLARVAKWVRDHGAYEADTYPYALFSI